MQDLQEILVKGKQDVFNHDNGYSRDQSIFKPKQHAMKSSKIFT